MTSLFLLLLRPLLERPMRLVARLVKGLLTVAAGDLVLALTLDADLPRGVTLALLAMLAAAWLFLRASWRRWRWRRSLPRERDQPAAVTSAATSAPTDSRQ